MKNLRLASLRVAPGIVVVLLLGLQSPSLGAEAGPGRSTTTTTTRPEPSPTSPAHAERGRTSQRPPPPVRQPPPDSGEEPPPRTAPFTPEERTRIRPNGVRLRASVGFDVADGTMDRLLDDPRLFRPQWGAPLTSEEASELDVRLRIQKGDGPLHAIAAAHPDQVGGVYLDQLAGGFLTVLLKADTPEALRQQLAGAAPVPGRIRFKSSPYSKRQLEAQRDQVERDASELRNQGIGLQSVSVDVASNRVRLGVLSSQDSADAALLRRRYPSPSVGIASEPPPLPANHVGGDRYDSTGPWKAGLAIESPDGGRTECTSGFVAEDRSSPGTHYLLTAGHCGSKNRPLPASEWYHGYVGNPARIGRANVRQYGPVDAARIDIDAGLASNLIHVPLPYGVGDTAIAVSYKQYAQGRSGEDPVRGDAVGDFVCHVGRNQYNVACGTVTALNTTQTYADGTTVSRLRRASFNVKGGDSGAAVYIPSGGDTPYGRVQDGVGAAGIISGTFDPNGADSLYQHVYDVENVANADVRTTYVTYELRNRASGKCIDIDVLSYSNGVPMVQYSCNYPSWQEFSIEPPASHSGYSIGQYLIRSRYNYECMDLRGPSTAAGTVIQGWQCVGVDNQEWLFGRPNVVPAQQNDFLIVSAFSDKCVMPSGGSTQSGTTLVQSDCPNGDTSSSKRWYLVYKG